ncbi:MAG: hypothetical protein LBN27_11735 [Prevotellaceae bacterium]|jgi:hypothetical protein|nr:hypothetical protein [Prevotellaceae bacterium]
MKANYFLINILLLFLFACTNNKTEKFYYDSGKLWYETYLVDEQKQTYHCTVYYKNGVVESEGTVLEDGTQNGEWKEYFSDGVLKWIGRIDTGHYVIRTKGMPDFIHLPAKLEIEGNPKVLKIGETYKIRTIVEKVHPSIYRILVNVPNNIEKNKEDPDRFPSVITPQKIGKMYITLVFPNKDGYLIVGGEMNLSFVLEVVE